MTVVLKQYSRHRVALKKRDSLAFNASDRLALNAIGKGFLTMGNCYKMLQQYGRMGIGKVKTVFNLVTISFFVSLLKVVVVDYTEFQDPTPREGHVSFEDYGGYLVGDTTFSEYFRFQSVNQLKRLCRGFQIPEEIKVDRSVFTGEEVVIISLLRLSYPSRWTDVINKLPRNKKRSRCECGRAFRWFLDFMISNWGYLVLNNMVFWLPLLGYFAEAIRIKTA